MSFFKKPDDRGSRRVEGTALVQVPVLVSTGVGPCTTGTGTSTRTSAVVVATANSVSKPLFEGVEIRTKADEQKCWPAQMGAVAGTELVIKPASSPLRK